MKAFDWIFFSLVIIGGINWGLVGLFGFNVFALLFGADSLATNIIYITIGAAAIYLLIAIPAREAKGA